MIINNLDLVCMYGTLYPAVLKFTFFSSISRTFIISQLTVPESMSFNKHQKIDVVRITFSDCGTIKLECNPPNHVCLEI